MPSTAKLVWIDPKDIHKIWPEARPLIKVAIERTDLSRFEDIEAQVLSGDQFLWLAISDHIEAAAITHLVKAIGMPVLIITACSGRDRDRWLPLLAKIEDYARNEGAKCVRIYGRKGWERVLPGYIAEHVILEKELV